MIKVSIPATSANLGPGFDCLGMAINIYNTIEVEEDEEEGLYIEVPREDRHIIPTDSSNLIYRSMLSLFDKVGYRPGGIRIKQTNNIPLAMGLGSSAACIVGGVVAANHIAGNPLDIQEMIELSSNLDGHPDNVLPALVGGITVGCIHDEKVYHSRLDPPEGLCLALMIPQFELLTEEARAILPESIPFEDGVFNLGRASLLVASIIDGSMENLSIAMDDRMHQPYRKSLIPGFDYIRDKAIKSGAKGTFLSGAGPIIIAIVDEGDRSYFEEDMKSWLSELDDVWTLKWAKINNEGIKTTIY